MAKKKAPTRARSRAVVKTATKKRSRSSNTGLNPMKAVTGGLIYGAVRGKVASMIQPITSKMPMGNYADEAGMMILSYFVAKGKIKVIPKNVGLAGLMIESAVIGNDIGSGAFTGNLARSSTATTTRSF